ncbi:MAG: lysophospholipid acyltransferase family protein [Muribaculaceae bacterium]|nr:lysophospholipid acyltransferase family protein [Muribaculaceae bacterium]
MGYHIILFLLKILALLPFGVLYLISDGIAFILYHVIRYRRNSVRKNLVTSFPELSISQIKKIEKSYYRFMCDVMVETIKLLHISEKNLSSRVTLENWEEVDSTVANGNSVVIFMGHYGNWEWAQEMGRYMTDTVYRGSIYHEMRSEIWERLFCKIRSRWNLTILPQNKTVRALLDKKHLPWIFAFIADQRPRMDNEQYHTRFLNHDTQFIIGPESIGSRVNARYYYLDIKRPRRGYYNLILKKLEPSDSEEKYPYTVSFWKEFEKTIRRDPSLWLWSHNRWRL